MTKFTTGLIAGSVIGAIGLTCALSDRKTRRKIMRNGKHMMHKAENMIDRAEW